MELVEHIHEILCLIASLHASSETDGSLPPALLYDIATFTEILQKIYSFLNAPQGMGKLKRLFKQSEKVSQLEVCKNEVQGSLDVFRRKVGVLNVAEMSQMHMDAKRRHEELLSLLATHTDLTNSDNSSSVSQHLHSKKNVSYLSSSSSGSLSMLPPLASAALHHDDVVVKYPYRYFVPCHSTATCADLVSRIASYIGLEKGVTHKGIFRHFLHSLASLLVLDSFETPWEPVESRAKVEEFLSYLSDVSHLAILVSLIALR
ncbi:hypothetical protein B0H10DRAFT_2026843 [Mycena sp. CBHHK59/15]|nr:hypothetical protein B0H10DRAFT_2026843 [Mycena sp. CBHHK59/15]